MRVYLTHCSKEKNIDFKATGVEVTPDQLYIDSDIQRFMQRCKDQRVDWAILSDRYGVFRSSDRQKWYEKHPDTVTQAEEDAVIQDFDNKLNHYNEIWFYVRPDSFHPFYQRVLKKTALASRVQVFQDVHQIKSILKT